MRIKNKNYNGYRKLNKHTKKNKTLNNYIQTIFKIICVIILIYYIYYTFPNNIKKIDMNNNNWIKKNVTEFINNYLSILKRFKDAAVLREIKRLKEYLSLKVIIKGGNTTLNFQTKEYLIKSLNEKSKKNFSLVKNIFITEKLKFGNLIVSYNNLIYYSELLGIKNIYLNNEITNWYIKNDINTDKIHISFISRNLTNCSSYDTFCATLWFFHFQTAVKSERRSLLLKDEIKRNLPKIITNKKDLYIFIRSGDSFSRRGSCNSQAPYCFYQKIISEFKFRDIYLISQNDKSPIIKKLLKDYPKIKHKLNSKEIDMSILMNAYNLVNAVSSFSLALISFNDNLINLFEYELYKLGRKIVLFHYDIDKLDRKFNVYRMKPSEEYFIKMFNWINTEEQRQLLFEEKCKYNFRKTKYTETIFD